MVNPTEVKSEKSSEAQGEAFGRQCVRDAVKHGLEIRGDASDLRPSTKAEVTATAILHYLAKGPELFDIEMDYLCDMHGDDQNVENGETDLIVLCREIGQIVEYVDALDKHAVLDPIENYHGTMLALAEAALQPAGD